MLMQIYKTKQDLGRAAAEKGGELIKNLLERKKTVRFILATGASQFEMLETLVAVKGIDWSRTEMFHLDEYVGLSADHPASFRKYLRERFVEKAHPGKVHFLEGDAPDPAKAAEETGKILASGPIDLAFVGIGENGHLAFNDPPADFETEKPYLIVNLDEACRKQQMGEGWFSSLDAVPKKAISMSIRQIMKSDVLIACVPDLRKAVAVRDCLAEGRPISPLYPSSILKNHPQVFIYLDEASASLLRK